MSRDSKIKQCLPLRKSDKALIAEAAESKLKDSDARYPPACYELEFFDIPLRWLPFLLENCWNRLQGRAVQACFVAEPSSFLFVPCQNLLITIHRIIRHPSSRSLMSIPS